MISKFTYCYASVLVLLNLLDKSYLSSNPNSFYSTNEDVRYLVDNIPVSLRKEFSGGSDIKLQSIIDEPLYSPKVYLKFFPPVLDFKKRVLGVPHHEKVTIINTSCNKSVHMSSISGNTVHFHSSFFQDKVIPPLGNTSFNVVFLGRGEGEIESTLFIHTSEGSYKYLVKGESVLSPYRLRPFSGVRLPLNASYSPLILMYNPHSTPIQLVEVYSSGGDFHLELPSGELEGPKHMWNIPAFLTKPIIRLRFHASLQKNHTAYIRVKVDQSSEVLVIPVDVEVGSVCGLYSSDDLIDFGIGGTEDPPKQVKIYLKNSWKKAIKVQNVISMPVSRALKIDFQPIKVPPDSKIPTHVATVTFDWKAALASGHTSGRVIVKSSQGGQKLVLAYTATVLDGGLHVDSNLTKFQSDQLEIQPRTISITNNYKSPVAVMNVTLPLEASFFFQITELSPSIILPGVTRDLTVLEVIGGSLPPHLKFESELTIHTNVSTISIPLLCYDGKLLRVLVSDTNDTELHVGTVGSGTNKIIDFALINENPVPVKINDMSLNISGAYVHVVAVEKGNSSAASIAISSHNFNSIVPEPQIEAGYYCIVRVSIPAGTEPGSIYGEVKIASEFETILLPLFMRVEHGSLKVVTDPIEFMDCFPSAICSAEVRVESNFTVGMAITSVATVPHQPKLGFIPVSPPLIPPLANSLLGHITWDMSGVESYLSPTANATGGQRWTDSLTVPNHIREWDISLLTSRFEQYMNISSELIEISLRLDTTEVRNLEFKAVIKPAWPSILPLPTKNITFPLTQVGKLSYQQLTIVNPALKHAIVVQLLLDSHYPLARGILDDLPPCLRPSINMSTLSSDNDFESAFQLKANEDLIPLDGAEPFKKSLTFVLYPMSNASISIAFKPENAQPSSSLLLIRNNLTILEAVQLHGAGAYAQFKFGNRKPGSSTPLLFELVEKHLKDCEKGKNNKNIGLPNLTVKRSFTARNTGALPLTVLGFTINGHLCQGFGFRVLNCHPFLLPANSSKKIDIAFTPDFTLSRVTRMLTVFTSDCKANYTLIATLPPYLLSACSAVLGRPGWEPLVYYTSVCFMLFLLVCVLAAAIFESNRILRNTIIALSRDQTVQPVLDLRTVGSEVNDDTPELNEPIKDGVSTKLSWGPIPSLDPEVHKEHNSTSSENSVNYSFNNKCSLSNSLLNNKRKQDRSECKRYNELDGGNIEKTTWDSIFSPRQNSNNHVVKPAKSISSGICFTTEPYTPLTNLKPREVPAKVDGTIKMKIESPPIQRPIDVPLKKPKKKAEDFKKKCESSPNLNSPSNHDDADSSSTSTDSSSNDDGDKEVESMFFKSVRHHLQTKAGKSRINKFQETSPLKGKKFLEKRRSSSMENDWEAEEDVVLDKATVVKSTRRPNSSSKLKKPSSGPGKMLKLDSAPPKIKLNPMDKSMKSSSRRDKAQIVKKRVDKHDKHNSMKGAHHDGMAPPPPPPPPIWTASFSDVVARSDSSYSSVVALKNPPQPMIHKQPMSVASMDHGYSYSNSHHKEYPAEWKTDYKEMHEQQEPECISGHQSTRPVGAKRPYNTSWNNWSTLTNSLHCPNNLQQTASANSLFAHSPQHVTTNNFDNMWNDPNVLCHANVLKALQDRRDVELDTQPTFSNNDINWPVMPSLWEPLYTPSATVENPPPVWGSDVWAPPTPPSPNQEEIAHHPMEYDPFKSLSNIWAQHSTNIWKPPTTE